MNDGDSRWGSEMSYVVVLAVLLVRVQSFSTIVYNCLAFNMKLAPVFSSGNSFGQLFAIIIDCTLRFNIVSCLYVTAMGCHHGLLLCYGIILEVQ